MKQRLRGKVALITGGSRGIGRAIAGAFATEGASVFICGRHEASVEKAVAEIGKAGGAVSGRAADIGQEDQVERIVNGAAELYGRIDVLVNNASALGPRLPIAEYPSSAWEEVLRVNLWGLFLVTKQVVQLMLPRQQGSIINVSSGVGRIGKPRWGAYAVSKFGLEGFTQMLAEEVEDFGIRVNAVNPGPTRTKMRAEAYPDEDPMKLPQPDEITEVFTYLASDDSVQVTGKSLDAQDWTKRRN